MAKNIDYFEGMSEKDIKEYNDAMKQLDDEAKEQYIKDQALIETVKKQVSKRIFKEIEYEIEESDNYSNFRIVNTPDGDPQRKDIIKTWVVQCSVGDSGDSFEGEVFIELPDGKYLTWQYWT